MIQYEIENIILGVGENTEGTTIKATLSYTKRNAGTGKKVTGNQNGKVKKYSHTEMKRIQAEAKAKKVTRLTKKLKISSK